MNNFAKYPGYNGIMLNTNQTNGTYNGFQTGLRVQNRWGLSGELDYTYSHEIDITSYDRTTVSNPWNFKYDKGSGALDRRNILRANYIYKLPFFNKTNDLVHSIAGGWEIAGTIIDESGVPNVFNDSLNYDPVGLDGGYTVRPNLAGKMKYNKKMGSWFDTSHYSQPVPAWLSGPNMGFGNAGKDYLVGPGRVNFTTSLYKTFSFWDKASFTLRFESFNTFNHSEFSGINAGMSCNSTSGTGQTVTQPCAANPGTKGYGQVNNAWDPRNLELGAKLVF